MLELYPTRPVVSNNAALLASYNAHPDSPLMGSQCLTSDQALSLLDKGAKFEAIVCIDKDGVEVLSKIGHDASSDVEFDTRVEYFSMEAAPDIDVDAIHSKVKGENFMLYGMG